jgi:predicted 3-demethylubiquinone-9 3-methyltransferase (glyoxalase superfamily)
MRKITPFLWFDSQAEEAANFYCSVFPNSKIVEVSRYGDGGPGPAGSVMVVAFELNGQAFNALNGGPIFKFDEAISFVVECENQDEVDHYWEKLTDGGKEVQCGWLKDRFGLSWQVVPMEFFELVGQPDKAAASRVMAAMMQMVKFDVAKLREAARG